jgi:hypothetical protein
MSLTELLYDIFFSSVYVVLTFHSGRRGLRLLYFTIFIIFDNIDFIIQIGAFTLATALAFSSVLLSIVVTVHFLVFCDLANGPFRHVVAAARVKLIF